MVVNEMMDAFTEKFDSKDVQESFVIESREGKQYIPLSQIYYIEARERRYLSGQSRRSMDSMTL